ncbi:hypothetical protein PFISCL1PPCAC_27966, partial [Pristionchus fissidentatus]
SLSLSLSARGSERGEVKFELLQMLAPVVTKEMQLFKLGPTNKNNLRNVRARAQSLNEGLSTGSITKQQLQGTRSVSAGGHRAPKSSLSMGNLPLLSGSANSSGPSSTNSSPPKSFSVRKATLDPIVEGVELGAVSSPAIVQKKRSSGSSTDQTQPPTLQKHATSDSLATKEKDEKKKKEGGVFGWFSKTFSKKSSRGEDQPGTSRDTAAAEAASSSSSEGADESPSKKAASSKR